MTRRIFAAAVSACVTLLGPSATGPVAAQEPSYAERLRADMLKRAQGIGEAQKRACIADVQKKLGAKSVQFDAWEQNFKLTTYIDAGGWPGRTANPRYQSTLVIMNAVFSGDGTMMATMLAGNRVLCFYNREGNRLRFLTACLQRDVCKLP